MSYSFQGKARPCPFETAFVVQAKLTSFKAAARLQLRTCLAHHIQLPVMKVTIEGIKSGCSSMPAALASLETAVSPADGKGTSSNQVPTATAAHTAAVEPAVQPSSSGVTVAAHVQLGSAKEPGQQLAAALQTVPHTILTDGEMIAAIGAIDAGSVQAEVIDVTPGLACDSSSPTMQADNSVPPQQAKNTPQEVSQELTEVSMDTDRSEEACQGACCAVESCAGG